MDKNEYYNVPIVIYFFALKCTFLFFYKAILQNCSSLEIAWSYSYLTIFNRKRSYYFISEKI